jgi:uncharacterized protein (DUF2126 family)
VVPRRATAALVAQLLLARDGVPIWHNSALIADEQQDYGADGELAGRFLASVAERLKFRRACFRPTKTISTTCGAKAVAAERHRR